MRRNTWIKVLAAFVTIVLIVVAAGLSWLNSVAERIPAALSRELGVPVAIGNTHISPFAKTITFDNIRLRQPTGYGADDALTIRRVTVSFAGYDRTPLDITSVTVQGMQGNPRYVGTTDNFAIIQQLINTNYQPPVGGDWATPTVLRTIAINGATIMAGNVMQKLPDRNSQPVSTPENPKPLKEVAVLTLYKLLQYERQALTPPPAAGASIDLNAINDRAARAIEKVGNSFKNLFNELVNEFDQPDPAASAPAQATVPESGDVVKTQNTVIQETTPVDPQTGAPTGPSDTVITTEPPQVQPATP